MGTIWELNGLDGPLWAMGWRWAIHVVPIWYGTGTRVGHIFMTLMVFGRARHLGSMWAVMVFIWADCPPIYMVCWWATDMVPTWVGQCLEMGHNIALCHFQKQIGIILFPCFSKI